MLPTSRRAGVRLGGLVVIIVGVLGAAPAHGDGVSTSIGNGDYKYGTVTATNVDTYTFTVSTGGETFFSLGEVGPDYSSF